MKLLLTSSGLTNQSIANALFELVGKPPTETAVTFIPTASNVEFGDKGWLIDDLLNLHRQNFKSISIADISAVPEQIWRPQLEEADVLFFEGGNTYHLMNWINKSGLAKTLSELLKNKVYVGVSAGSMVACKDLLLSTSQRIYEEDLDKDYELAGLNYVHFYVLPHLNSKYFPKLREEMIRESTKDIKEKIYALDDQSAIKVVDGNIEIISEGQWFEVN